MHRLTWRRALLLGVLPAQLRELLLPRRLFQTAPLLICEAFGCLLTLLLLLEMLLLLLLLLFRHLVAERLNLALMVGLLFPQVTHLFLLLRRGFLRHLLGRFDDGGIELPPQCHL